MLKALSLDERQSLVRRAVSELGIYDDDLWVVDVYDTYVVIEDWGLRGYWQADYSLDDSQVVTLQPRSAWVRVEKEWAALKTASMLATFSPGLKALGDGQVGGYLVVFGDEAQTDLDGDYFTKATDFDIRDGDPITVYYQHGLDPVLKRRKLGKGTLKTDEVGVWMEAQLDLRDQYEQAVYDLVGAGKMGLSSGTLPNLIEREWTGKAFFIKSWPLGKDGSITPIPAEWRTGVLPMKALLDSPTGAKPEVPPEASLDAVERRGAKTADIRISEDKRMSENNTPPVDTDEVAALKAENKAISERMDKVLKFMEDSPALKNAGFFTMDGGVADKAIKSAPDMLMAIKRGDVERCVKHYGLKAQVEVDGARGGYYVPDSLISDLMPSLSLTSGLGQLVRRIPVSTPSGQAPIRDYSRVPTANVGQSASAAGLATTARMEGGAYTEQTMYFELLKWNVGDYASGFVKMSRELSQDAPMVQAMLEEGIREDVANKEEWAILRGSGVDQPLGVLNWAGTIGVAEDTDDTFDIADSDEMVSRLLQRAGARIAWAHHPGVYTDVAGFERGTGAVAYQQNISGALSTALHGYPRFASQHLPAQGTSGYVVLGDWASYILFDYKGLYIEYSEHADFLNGNNVWRFGKRQDGMPAMTGPVTLADGSFTLSPFVKLNNKTT